MSIAERELEENEAKLDNILHKIIASSKQIRELQEHINLNLSPGYNEPTLAEIKTLAEIIENLATLADDIDITDESLTHSAEADVKSQLDLAIAKISAVKSMLRDI